MPNGTFTAYGDLANVGSTAQVLAATQSVNLTIVPHGGATPAFNQNMTPGSDGVGPFESLSVAGLSPGRYFANWSLTDSHGDTAAFSNLFAVQPGGGPGPQGPAGATGSAGATGPAGSQGSTGPAGKNGSSSAVICVVTVSKKATGKGKHQKTVVSRKTVCTVKVLAPGAHTVSVDLSRGRTTFAAGTAAVRAGSARVTLRGLRPLVRGRYLVTVVATTGGKKGRLARYWLVVR
jgi:hypothetical protein